ncbi:MAG: hypothetical protein ACO3I0_03020 [Limisphaerales bacterium]
MNPSTAWTALRTVLLCLLAVMGVDAAQVFTIDPTRSSLTISGNVLGSELTAQGPGSLTTSLLGTVRLAADGGAIQFPGDSRIVATTNGSWQPLADGSKGSAPASFGGRIDIGLAAGDAGLRDVQLDLSSASLPLEAGRFDASRLVFAFDPGAKGSFAYDVTGLVTRHGVLPLAGSATNAPTTSATLAVSGTGQVLTIPINATFRSMLLTPDDTLLTLQGQLVAVLDTVPPSGQTFDLASDFSVDANPTGTWEYGYATRMGGELIVYIDRSASSATYGVWRNDIFLGCPSTFINLTDAILNNGTQQLGPRMAGSHPGPNGEYSVFRFSVPSAGEYQLKASFEGADVAGTTTDAHVLLNDGPIFTGAVNGFGAASRIAFGTNLVLRVGDRVDFAVGHGGNGFFYDSTGVAASLVRTGPSGPTQLPVLGSFSVNAGISPIRTSNPWRFQVTYPAEARDLRLRIQSTTTPADEGSWTDLPGDPYMTRLDSEWNLGPVRVPEGNRYFRAIASAPGFLDRTSPANGPTLVLPASPLPILGSFSVSSGTSPVRTSNPWRFQVTYPPEISDLRLRIQSTLTPGDEASWSDLPGNPYMARSDAEWTLRTTQVPEGNRHFRAIASAPGYLDRLSGASGPWLVLPGLAPLRGFTYATVLPYQGGTGWSFSIVESAVVPGLRLRVQSSTRPEDPGSWTDLPGGGLMARQPDERTWAYYTPGVPIGQVSFRVIASAPDHADLISGVLGPFDVIPTVSVETAKVTQAGSYSLQSLPGWLAGAGNFIVNAVGAVVRVFVPEKASTAGVVTLTAADGSTTRLTVDEGQVLTAGGVNVGPSSSAIITGTLASSLLANPLIGVDAGTLTGVSGSSLVGRDVSTAEVIATASLLQRSDSPVISATGSSVVSSDSGGLIGVDAGTLIGVDAGSMPDVDGGSLARHGDPADPSGIQPSFTGPIRVTGDYTQAPGAALMIGIAGIRSSPDGLQQYDQLVVGGRANFLGGRIVFGFFNPEDASATTGRFEPAVGSSFDVVVARSIHITGLTVRGPVWADGRFFRWGVVTRPDGLQALRLVVVKVPPILSLRSVESGLELSYATNYVGYRLESSTLGNPTTWSLVSTNPGPHVVTTTEKALFYRVSKAP